MKNTSRHLVNVKLGQHDKKSVMRQLYFLKTINYKGILYNVERGVYYGYNYRLYEK